ncbi:MAG: SRPBCC family protein [Pyrinomonadaceae bacterium]
MQKVYTVTASALAEAPAETVYAILADYRDGHPHILPRKYFTSLAVERGGFGDGTVIRFGMRAFGKTREARAAVTEPEPGRVLVETALDKGGPVTTFVVEPEGSGARVTFRTQMTSRGGLLGAAERFVASRFLKRVYALELAQLGEFARKLSTVNLTHAWAQAGR